MTRVAARQYAMLVSDRQSAPMIAVVRRPAGLDSARRLRDAQTIFRSRRQLDRGRRTGGGRGMAAKR